MKQRMVSGIHLTLLLMGMLTLALYVTPVNGTTILSQDFDDELTGSVPDGWTVADPSEASLKVNETIHYGTNGKSAKYMVTGSEWDYVGRTFANQSGYLVVEF